MFSKYQIKWTHPLGLSLGTLFLGKAIHYFQSIYKSEDVNQEYIWGLVISSIAFFGLLSFRFDKYKFGSFPALLFSIFIFISAFLHAFDGQDFIWPYFPEYGLQILLPFCFFAFSYRWIGHPVSVLNVLTIATAFTFFGHGILAMGTFFPVPGHFIEMTTGFFNCSHETAVLLLQIWGILDMIVIIGLFIPQLRKYALFYAFVWGMITAFARVVGYWSDDSQEALLLNSGGVIFRFLHGLIPLYLLMNHKKIKLL